MTEWFADETFWMDMYSFLFPTDAESEWHADEDGWWIRRIIPRVQ